MQKHTQLNVISNGLQMLNSPHHDHTAATADSGRPPKHRTVPSHSISTASHNFIGLAATNFEDNKHLALHLTAGTV
jgi:hypothetical protein